MDHNVQNFFDRAQELIENDGDQDKLLDALSSAEQLLPENPSLLCQSAKLLFRYGVLNHKGPLLLLAHDKIKRAQEMDPNLFEDSSEWWQLWGNILIEISLIVNDIAYIEMALEKFQYAEQAASGFSPSLYWDWGKAWRLLGNRSGEGTDFQQALGKFNLAKQAGEDSPFFRIEMGRTWVAYGVLRGDPHVLDEALLLFNAVIADTCYPDSSPSRAFRVAFKELALCLKQRYMLSHKHEDFEEADKMFREAILASSKNAELLLDWGELYLHSAWLKQDITLVERGLEKLTSTKIRECNPLRVSTWLGLGLVIYGLFSENLKLIKEGQQRIDEALEIAPDSEELMFASGFSQLGFALFFSDSLLFSRAAQIFEHIRKRNTTNVANWYMLFQVYFNWGMLEKDRSLAQKGLNALAFLARLRPHSAVIMNEWGIAFLKVRHLESERERQFECVEEAIFRFQSAWELSEEIEVLYHWGCALDLLGEFTGDEESFVQAVSFLTQVYKKQPSDIPTCFHLGLALSHLGELTQHVDLLEQAIQLLEMVAYVENEDEGVWCELGYALLNQAELIFDPILPEKSLRYRSEAEKKLLHAVELGSGDACYHLACLYSLAELYDASMHYLRKAEQEGFLPLLADLEKDEWLENVRKTQAFREFLLLRARHG